MKLDFTDWKTCFDGFALLTPLNINTHSALEKKKGVGGEGKEKALILLLVLICIG